MTPVPLSVSKRMTPVPLSVSTFFIFVVSPENTMTPPWRIGTWGRIKGVISHSTNIGAYHPNGTPEESGRAKMGLGRFSSLVENNSFFMGVFCGNTDEELIVVKALCEYRGPVFAEPDSSGVPFGMTNCAIFNWNPDERRRRLVGGRNASIPNQPISAGGDTGGTFCGQSRSVYSK
jgi:hypothetical protein